MRYRLIFVFLLSAPLFLAPIFAQQSSTGSSSSKSRHTPEQHMKASPSAVSNEGLYRNSEFGFTYSVRYGWVDRTRQMQDNNNDPSKSQLLLAAFEHPPEATGDAVNSAVIIAAESVASYPGLKTAADYIGFADGAHNGKGFKVVHEPYEFPVDAKPLVRSDFVKDLGKLTMRQSSLVLLEKHFVLSFTFIGSSEDEVEELVEKLDLHPKRP